MLDSVFRDGIEPAGGHSISAAPAGNAGTHAARRVMRGERNERRSRHAAPFACGHVPQLLTDERQVRRIEIVLAWADKVVGRGADHAVVGTKDNDQSRRPARCLRQPVVLEQRCTRAPRGNLIRCEKRVGRRIRKRPIGSGAECGSGDAQRERSPKAAAPIRRCRSPGDSTIPVPRALSAPRRVRNHGVLVIDIDGRTIRHRGTRRRRTLVSGRVHGIRRPVRAAGIDGRIRTIGRLGRAIGRRVDIAIEVEAAGRSRRPLRRGSSRRSPSRTTWRRPCSATSLRTAAVTLRGCSERRGQGQDEHESQCTRFHPLPVDGPADRDVRAAHGQEQQQQSVRRAPAATKTAAAAASRCD